MPSRRHLLTRLAAPFALLLLGRGRPVDPADDDVVMVDGWILRRSDLERHG